MYKSDTMYKNENICFNIKSPLSSVIAHEDISCITRYFAEGSPVYTAIHEVSNANHPNTYTQMHSHEEAEINILIGNDENFKYEVCIGDETHIVESNTTVYFPSGVPHSANVISGSGYYIAIRLDKNNPDSGY